MSSDVEPSVLMDLTGTDGMEHEEMLDLESGSLLVSGLRLLSSPMLMRFRGRLRQEFGLVVLQVEELAC